MTEGLKVRMRGPCGKAGKHVKPQLDPDDVCIHCSSDHIDEFENSIGIVVGQIDLNIVPPEHPDYDVGKLWPEWDVRWQPYNLKYGYLPEDLEIIPE